MGYSINEMYPSTWLKAEDFEEGEDRVVTIKEVSKQVLGQGRDASEKYILEFEENDTKDLVLNKTNGSIVAKLYGPHTDDWLGRQVTLFTMDVQSFDDIVRAIRIRPRVPANNQAKPRSNGVSSSPQGSGMISNEQKIAIQKLASQRWPDQQEMLRNLKEFWTGPIAALTSSQADGVIAQLTPKMVPDAEVNPEDDPDFDPFAD